MWARVAEREGVDVFVIGSEMNALTATKAVFTLPGYYSYFENEKHQREENEVISRLAYQYRPKVFERNRDVGKYMSLAEYLHGAKNCKNELVGNRSHTPGPSYRLKKINHRRELLGRQHWEGLSLTRGIR